MLCNMSYYSEKYIRIYFIKKKELDETLIFIAFVIGFSSGVLLGCRLILQLAIYLGFKYGELPTLPRW
jgi:hypothetical protein